MIRVGSLFSGAGGLDLAVEQVTGGTVVWQSEVDPSASKVLDTHWPDVPNLGDITKIDWDEVMPVDVLCGGFPCQDVSLAGLRAGLAENTRSGLWSHFAEAIEVLRPSLVVIENVKGLLSAKAKRGKDDGGTGGLLGSGAEGVDAPAQAEGASQEGEGTDPDILRAMGAVLGDLSEIGYDAHWTTLSAASVGAPHIRDRVFILAYPQASGGGQLDAINAGHGTGRAELGVEHDLATGGAGQPGEVPAHPDDAGQQGEAHDARRGEPDAPGRDLRDQQPEGFGEARCCGSGAGPVKGCCSTAGTPDVVLIPTPRSRDYYRGRRPNKQRQGTQGPDLPTVMEGQLTYMGTPQARDYKGLPGRGFNEGSMWWSAMEMVTDFGKYAEAVRRWESLTRPAPAPVEADTKGNPRLRPEFSEWAMGFDKGWITEVEGLGRVAKFKTVGNGVVPQQAVAALKELLSL